MITRNPTLYTGRQPGYPQRQEDVARLLKFRDNPSDESWINGGKN